MIVIATNSGGTWSPIGDVTTIMLWMRAAITAANLIANLFLPCLVSVVITAIAVRTSPNRPPPRSAPRPSHRDARMHPGHACGYSSLSWAS